MRPWLLRARIGWTAAFLFVTLFVSVAKRFVGPVLALSVAAAFVVLVAIPRLRRR